MPAKNQQLFYEWVGVADQWITSEESFDNDYPSKPISTGDSIAKWVIETVFELPLGSTDKGGDLPGYDIIGRDPYEMIRLSLASELINGDTYECYMDEDGVVRFYLIGDSPSIYSNDVLYSIDNGEMKLKCDNVMVTGYDPPPKRYTGNNGEPFDLLSFANGLTQSASPEYQDKDANDNAYPLYTVFGEILGPEACTYKYEGQIEYGGDPDALTTIDPAAIESAGVYNSNDFESVITYLYKIDIPFYDKNNTEIKFSDVSTRYIDLDKNFGKLQTRSWTSNERYVSALCTENELTYPDDDAGVELPRSDEFKFKGVSAVYIYGYRLNSIRLNCTFGSDGNIVSPTTGDFLVTLDTMYNEPIQLSEGEDYIVFKKSDGSGLSKIVFSCNVREEYLEWFGGNYSSCKFKIDPSCIYADRDENATDTLAPMLGTESTDASQWYRSGYLSDIRYEYEVSSNTYYADKTIFPTGEGSSGYVVDKIIVVYQWDNPSVIISDRRNNVTRELLEQIDINFYPIIMQDKPAPIAINGALLDQNEVRPDYDPTTAQIFETTPYMLAMSSLEAGDVRVTMPFADEDDCIKISNAIKDVQQEISHEVIYTCSPDATPVLGTAMGDGVINEIDYSYQDSSQYLISVTVGPKWRGGDSWDNSIYNMETDNPVLTGTILKIAADNIKCNVRVNKIGVIECVNQTREKLEVGDKVSVTLYNNPISL